MEIKRKLWKSQVLDMIKMGKSTKFQNYRSRTYTGNRKYVCVRKTPSESLVGHDFSTMITLLCHLCQYISVIRYIFII